MAFKTPSYSAYRNNPLSAWYWEHGGEEIIGPLGPYGAHLAHAVAQAAVDPHPWRVAVGQLVEAVQAKDLASKLPKGQQEQVMRSSTAAIAEILDDWCGTPPRKWPWPWPGPPPWVWEIASELSMIANSLSAGSLRDGMLDVAAQVIQKGSNQRG
jgi:hypothetical protein